MRDLLGKVLQERYEVKQFLGQGSIFTYFRVFDRVRNVFLIMNILTEAYEKNPQATALLKILAKTHLDLSHPNIKRCYGTGEDQGIFFTLYEDLGNAESLKTIISVSHPNPLSWELVNRVSTSVCDAAGFIHKNNLAHGDIQPMNILFTPNGRIILTGFKFRPTDCSLHGMSDRSYSPPYSAPEVLAGEPPSPRSDVYSIGVCLYEMLSGGLRPYETKRVGDWTSSPLINSWERIEEPFKSLIQINKNVNRKQDGVISQCLEKEPAKRFLNGSELLNAWY